jgi:GNAT superfamily N-acetyltransferase
MPMKPPGSQPQYWRAMDTADIAFVLDLAACLYPDHPESRDSFAEKLQICPEACRIAEEAGRPAGYCVALWTTRGRPPRLDATGYRPAAPLSLHLHDLALEPSVRGRGLVPAALAHLAAVAGGVPLSLVAVKGTHALWRHHGFADAPCDGAVLASYGKDAVYMGRTP